MGADGSQPRLECTLQLRRQSAATARSLREHFGADSGLRRCVAGWPLVPDEHKTVDWCTELNSGIGLRHRSDCPESIWTEDLHVNVEGAIVSASDGIQDESDSTYAELQHAPVSHLGCFVELLLAPTPVLLARSRPCVLIFVCTSLHLIPVSAHHMPHAIQRLASCKLALGVLAFTERTHTSVAESLGCSGTSHCCCHCAGWN